jgi:hydroxymethylglutaryl-CoA lyase
MTAGVAGVEIVEVAPRDGLQNERVVLSTADKVELIRRTVAAGARRVEVASFVNPTRVPQMADAEAVVAALPGALGRALDGRPAGDRPHSPTRSMAFMPIGLVLNRRGLDRALATGIGEVNYVVGATDEFSQANQGMSTAASLAVWGEVAAAAHGAGVRASVTISVAFGCPFAGEVAPGHVAELAGEATAAGADEVALGDTIGAGVPGQVREVVAAVAAAAPGVPLRCHFHNTRNTGLANAYAAVEAGVRILDASVGGVGGCPFAPAATGNVPTEDLAWMLGRMGVPTGLDLRALIDTAAWLGDRLGKAQLPALLGRAGVFP